MYDQLFAGASSGGGTTVYSLEGKTVLIMGETSGRVPLGPFELIAQANEAVWQGNVMEAERAAEKGLPIIVVEEPATRSAVFTSAVDLVEDIDIPESYRIYRLGVLTHRNTFILAGVGPDNKCFMPPHGISAYGIEDLELLRTLIEDDSTGQSLGTRP